MNFSQMLGLILGATMVIIGCDGVNPKEANKRAHWSQETAMSQDSNEADRHQAASNSPRTDLGNSHSKVIAPDARSVGGSSPGTYYGTEESQDDYDNPSQSADKWSDAPGKSDGVHQSSENSTSAEVPVEPTEPEEQTEPVLTEEVEEQGGVIDPPAEEPAENAADGKSVDFSTVKPLIEANCISCHATIGIDTPEYWANHAPELERRLDPAQKAESFFMPPAGSGPYDSITPEEQAQLFEYAKSVL